MFRTKSMLRKVFWSLFVGAAMHAATTFAFAQAPEQFLLQKDAAAQPDGKDGKDAPKIIVVVINTTKTVGMTKPPGAAEEPIIEKVQNENPKVCRIQAVFNDPRHVLITGLSAGTSRVVFTGYNDPTMKDRHEEVFEVRVSSDEAELREKLRRDFLALTKKTVPTANIDALIVFSTTKGPVTVSTTSAANAPDSVNSTGVNDTRMVVFLSGNVLTADSVLPILESARAMFGANANVVNGMTVGGVQQIEVDCTICSVNRSKARNMSFSWSLNRKDWFLSSILGPTNFANTITTGIAAASSSQTTSGGNIIFGAVNNDGSFFGFLTALRNDGLAKIQAEPKVVTLSGRPAQFVSGGETPILTTAGQGSPSVTYKTFGTTITVLPILLGNGKIHLEIAPLISTLNQANGITIPGLNGTTSVPGFNTQGAQVAVQVEDGQTIAIGGLIQHTVNATNSKVPVLGDVPFLGAAFRTVNYQENEQELIILVTPRLVDPLACHQVGARLPTKLTRSPDDFELYMEGLLELPRGQRQTCGPNGCYQAPHNLGPTAGVFPCGDGNCGVNTIGGIRGHGHATGCATGVCTTRPGVTTNTAAMPSQAPAMMQAPIQQMAMPAPAPTAIPMQLPSGAPASIDMAPQTYAPATSAEVPQSGTGPVSYNAVPSQAPIAAPALRLPVAVPQE